MNKFLRLVPVILVVVLVAACGRTSTVYLEPSSPESLLDLSSERVAFALDLPLSVDEMSDWINEDQPTSAELYCSNRSSLCSDAAEVLRQFGVSYESKIASSDADEVVLIYDRVFTRDCDGHTEAAGCAVSANTVQMVVDPRQFLDPALLDLQDAEKASANFEKYLND